MTRPNPTAATDGYPMRVVERYSHLNGEEYLLVHRPKLWREVLDVIESVDANACKDKVSQEKSRRGRMLYSPISMNKAIATGFEACGWQERRQPFFVTSDAKILKQIYGLDSDAQRDAIVEAGLEPIRSYNQTDFVKDRVAVEVQFGKYAFVAHDLFVKHMAFFVTDMIDVGIEVLPMKELEAHMSSGVPYFERDLLNIIRQGRGVPAVPLVLLGVAP